MPPTCAFHQIYAWSNLLRAWRKARKGKRGKPAAAEFERNAGEHLLRLERDLQQGTYQPGAYSSFFVHDPKRRLISAAPFRDRVVHHALCNIIEPPFERRFIHDSYANRKGRGTHAALDRCQLFAQCNRYVLQGDVEQFFPAVDHQILLGLLAETVRDSRTLDLCRRILGSGEEVLRDEHTPRFFAGDDLFSVLRPRGLPIGNLTSQFWANVYLNPLDHFVKRRLRCRAYLRFVDDILLFSDSKAALRSWRAEILDFLVSLRLTLHERRFQARPVQEGIPFLGFVVFPHHRRLKRRKGIAYRRRLRGLLDAYSREEIGWDDLMASIQGWVNHARYAQTYGLRRQLFRDHPIVVPKKGGIS